MNSISRSVEDSCHIRIPGTPFERAAKGIVERDFTLNLESKKLDPLYADAYQPPTISLRVPFEAIGKDELTELLLRWMPNVTGWRRIPMDVKFCERPMTSLRAVVLSRRLRHLLRSRSYNEDIRDLSESF